MKVAVICLCLASLNLPLLVSARDLGSMTCWDKIQEEIQKENPTVLAGLLDSHGNPAQTPANARAVTYPVCRLVCGDKPDPFRWNSFAPHFTAWLLPWIALATLIPADLSSIGDKLLALVLTLGSPVLAAYSLHLTVLNNRWVDEQFRTIPHPRIGRIIDMIKTSPQFPLHIVTDNVVVPERIMLSPNGFHAFAFLWSILAFGITTSIYFTNGEGDIDLIGQGIGALWLWLLPITLGWSFQSIMSDPDSFQLAIDPVQNVPPPTTGLVTPALFSDNGHIDAASAENANALVGGGGENPYVNSPSHDHGPPLVNGLQLLQGTPKLRRQDPERGGSFISNCDQPVCNSARAFDCDRANIRLLTYLQSGVDPGGGDNRAYPVTSRDKPLPVPYALLSDGLTSRIAKASFLGLILQWGTTGGAMIIVYFTPTTGFECRSLSFIVYASISTLVWFVLLMSTILRSSVSQIGAHRRRFAAFLEIVGTGLAACNAVWLVLLCILQFAGFWSRCWCDSCVLSRGVSAAFNVFLPTAQDILDAKIKWIPGLVLAIGSSIVYIFVVFVRRA